MARFLWVRERQTYARYSWDRRNQGDTIGCRVNVHADKLFNVDAYKLGDYKQFYQDPRTRQEYLKWAPMLDTSSVVWT